MLSAVRGSERADTMALNHGGDTESFRLKMGYTPIDFSASCNPLGVPDGVKRAICEAAENADAYPDPLCRRLSAAIADQEGVLAEQVLCGNGSADLIYRLVLAIKPKRAVVTAPSFVEYEAALGTAGCEVMYHTLARAEGFDVTERILERLTPDIDMLFLCNPNNPTGRTIDPALLQRIVRLCEKNGILLMMDECFNGFLDNPEAHTLKGGLNSPNLLILKAFTKLYGMAGVRLGYCLSDSALLAGMQKAGQPWAVSSLAQAAGIAALNDQEYVQRARTLIREEKEYLIKALESVGIPVLGAAANYIFFYTRMPALIERLYAQGILIRDCANFAGLCAGYYRIAVRTHDENARLIAALDCGEKR